MHSYILCAKGKGRIKMKCPICGYRLKQGLKTGEETWKSPFYLAGVIDSEGCFAVTPREVAGKWYLPHVFAIALLATKEWKAVADYLHSQYGGRIYPAWERYYYRWVIYRQNQLLKFLNDYIPYLKIKHDGAERLRTSLIAYVQLSSKGKPTCEYRNEWIRKCKLRELKPLVIP